MTHTPSQEKLGADVSKLRIDVHLGTERGRRWQFHCANTIQGFEQLLIWLEQQQQSQVHICLEATGTYSDALALFFFERGHRVSVVAPHKLHAFRGSEGMSNKTDRLDAYLLALYARQKEPEAWAPASPAQEQLRRDLDRHEELLCMAKQEHNRLENQRLDAVTRKQILKHCDWLEREAEEWFALTQERFLTAWAQEHPCQPSEPSTETKAKKRGKRGKPPMGVEPIDLLLQVCGIQRLTALRMYAIIGDTQRFTSARHLAAYFGVTPVSKQSGTSVHGKPSIKRRGNATARRWLYMSALTCVRADPDFKLWAAQLRARGLCGKAVLIAVMNKLVRILYAILSTNTPYDATKAFPSHYVSTPAEEVSALPHAA